MPKLLLFLLFMGLAACQSQPPPPLPTPTLSPEAARGKQVFVQHCGACHSTLPDTVIVGPSLAGIATRAGQRVPDMDARLYLYASIYEPTDYVVDGFEPVMPTDFAKQLTGEDLDAVVVYLQTLK